MGHEDQSERAKSKPGFSPALGPIIFTSCLYGNIKVYFAKEGSDCLSERGPQHCVT